MENKILPLNRIRGVANYQFDSNIGRRFFPNEVEISFSKKTGKVRHIYLDGTLLATLRPRDGLFSLTIAGARRLSSWVKPPRFRAVMRNNVKEFAKKGRNIFARHVVAADSDIRPGEEVIITDDKDNVLAIGRALLTGREMLSFKRGVAVKTRRGIGDTKV